MTNSELDQIYSRFCETMTELGEERSVQFLCRFALLSITRAGDAGAVQRMIAEASHGLAEGPRP